MGNRKSGRRKARMLPIGVLAKKLANRMKRIKARRKKLH